MPPETYDSFGLNPCASNSCDVQQPVGAELVDVDQSFDQHELPSVPRRQAQDLGEAVRRQARAARAAQIQITRGAIGVIDRARPHGPDRPALVSPRAAEAAGPAAVCENAGLRDFELGVASRSKRALGEDLVWHDAEPKLIDVRAAEAAAFQ